MLGRGSELEEVDWYEVEMCASRAATVSKRQHGRRVVRTNPSCIFGTALRYCCCFFAGHAENCKQVCGVNMQYTCIIAPTRSDPRLQAPLRLLQLSDFTMR